MKKRFLVAWILTALAGSALHFAYPLLPYAAVGLFFPVSESVWEHLKLLYWPFLAAAAVLTYKAPDRPRAWSGFLVSMLAQPVALTAAYYLLEGGFGVSSLAADVALYWAVLGGGFWLARRVWRSGKAEPALGLLIVLTAIYGVSLVVFTLAAPNLPIFIAPQP